MTKRVIFLIIIVICSSFIFAGCDKTNTEINEVDEIIVPQEETFFDVSMLNYSEAYQNEQDPEEKGYIIFDYIDFNRIKFKMSFKRAPSFAIFFGEEHFGTIEKSPNGTVYPNYAFNKAGIYRIEVNASSGSGNMRSSFNIKVSSGGFPDKVEFELLNKSRNKVETGKGGEEYYLSAKVYSEDTFLEEDNEKYYSNWIGGDKGSREMLVTFPNLVEDSVLPYSFYCFLKKDNYEKSISSVYKVAVINNYEGISFDYGLPLTNNEATLSVSDFSGTAKFISSVKAQHNFTNGESKEVPIHYNISAPKEDTVTAFFRYDDGEYYRYSSFDYNTEFSKKITNYVNNGASYQFDPRESKAQVYLAYCYSEKTDGYTVRKYREIPDSNIFINLSIIPPQAINVISIYGSEKASNGGRIVFSDREVTDNQVTVKKSDPDLWQDWQYFNLDISLEGNTNIPDYYYEIEGNGEDNPVIAYNSVKKYFYATKVGISYINIKSCFSDVFYRLTIYVVE